MKRAATRLKVERKCITCGQTLPSSAFYAHEYTTIQGKVSVRHESRCKPCARERRRAQHKKNRAQEIAKMTARRQANKGRYAASLRAYRAANREKTLLQRRISQQRRIAAMHGQEDRALIGRVLDEARVGEKYLDAYSGALIDKPVVDHIVPLSAGGAHAYENLCVTSRQNNSSKHSKPLLVWLATR